MYRALYRKYRPTTFDDVVGQSSITAALSNQISADKIGHAYLFTGTRGTGKTTCAKLFANAVNCATPNGVNPCGVCDICVGLGNGSILDVAEIDAASNNGVDSIRMLRDETAYRPSHCKYKVYIIDEVHMLSTAAFNALLKIMEEPPSHIIFILATTEIHKVPATILSRCQRYDFLRIPADVISKRLVFVATEEGIKLSQEAADLISQLADGAMRDALSLLDTCAGTSIEVDEALVRQMAGVADKDYLFNISGAASAGDLKSIVELVALLREKSIDVKRLAEELIRHYRNFVLLNADLSGNLLGDLSEQDKARYIQNAGKITGSVALYAVKRLLNALDKMGRLSEPHIELELALFEICPPLHTAQNELSSQALAAPELVQSAELNAQKADFEPSAKDEQQPVKTAAVEESGLLEAPVQPELENGLSLFKEWDEVVQKMAAKDRLLYTYMKSSKAYQEGTRILIQGGDMFLSHMRKYTDSGEYIKATIAEVTGKDFSIGPYTDKSGDNRGNLSGATSESKQEKTLATLAKLEQMGLPVEYK